MISLNLAEVFLDIWWGNWKCTLGNLLTIPLQIYWNNSFGMSCNDGTPYISGLIKILYQRWTKFSDSSNYMHGFPDVKRCHHHIRGAILNIRILRISRIISMISISHHSHQYHISHTFWFTLPASAASVDGWCSLLCLTSLTFPRQKMMAATVVWGPWGHEHLSKGKYRPIPQNHWQILDELREWCER